MKTVVIGVGNPSRRDQSVGLVVARLLRDQLPGTSDVTIKEHWFGGFSLAELMAGFDRAVLVDATQTLEGKAGTFSRRTLGQLQGTTTLAAEGEFALPLAMESWTRAGLKMPTEVTIFGIEARDIETHGQDLTAPVARASVATALAIFADLDADDRIADRKAA